MIWSKPENRENKKVGIIIRQGLLVVILIALLIALIGVTAVQIVYQKMYSYSLIEDNIEDVCEDINEEFGELEEYYSTTSDTDADYTDTILSELVRYRRIGISGFMIVCDRDMNVIGSTEDMHDGGKLSGSIQFPEGEEDYNKARIELFGRDCYTVTATRPGYYILGAFPIEEAAAGALINVILTASLFGVILAAVFLCLSMMLNKQVVRGIEDINGSLSKITDGDLGEKASVKSSLEFAELSGGINHTVDRLKDMIEEADRKVESELEFAKRIQTSAVPNVFPPFPDNDEIGIYALMDTAKAVGGDFYDFFMINDDTLALVIADVSDKGMPAALFMMRAKTLIKTYAEQGYSVEEVAEKANKELCEENDEEMFVTAWLGFVSLKTGAISYVHAGHTYPVIVGNDGAQFVRNKKNLMLGSLSRANYVRQEVVLKEGDSLFLYTDGVTEARSTDGDMYGTDRLLGLMEKIEATDRSDKNRFCESVCRIVYDDVKSFAGKAEQSDDITMLVFAYSGDS